MSTCMISGSPAYQAKLADSKRRLREGYGHALAAKQQHTIRLLPPQLLPPPLPGSHAPGTTTKYIKDNIPKVARPQQTMKKPTAQRAQRLQKLGRNVNLSLPLHQYPSAASSMQQAQAANVHPPAALGPNPNATSAFTKHADTTAVARPKTLEVVVNDLITSAATATASPAITKPAARAAPTQHQGQAAMPPAALGASPNPAPTITKPADTAVVARPKTLRIVIKGLVSSRSAVACH